MAYTAEEQDLAVNAFIQQLENIRNDDVDIAVISPIANTNLRIHYVEQDLIFLSLLISHLLHEAPYLVHMCKYHHLLKD